MSSWDVLSIPASAVPPALRLDLFSDASFVIDLATWQRRGPGEIVWQGRVRDRTDSQVTFVSVAGVVAGTVRVVGNQAFEVRLAAGSSYHRRRNR